MGARKKDMHVAVFTAASPRGAAGAAGVEALRQALAPESGRGLPGASVKVRRMPGSRGVEIRIEAETLRSLRAAVNSYLRWAALALEVASRVEGPAEEE